MPGRWTDIFLVRRSGVGDVCWLRAHNSVAATDVLTRAWTGAFAEPLPTDLVVHPAFDEDLEGVPELGEWLVREALRRSPPPEADAIARMDVSVREDSGGDPAVYATVVFHSSGARRAWPRRAEIERHVRDVLRRAVPDLWPYIGFSADDDALNPEAPIP
jgi:hypothetical protein